MLDDLEEGILPVDPDAVSAQEAWESCYRHMPEFVDVVFTQFEARLKDYRKKVGEQTVLAAHELRSLEHDRHMFPRQTTNNRGEPVFDLSAAKLLLRSDIADGKHSSMTPHQLQQSRREYEPFSAKVFRKRIYQEIGRVKFLHHLEKRRAKGLRYA